MPLNWMSFQEVHMPNTIPTHEYIRNQEVQRREQRLLNTRETSMDEDRQGMDGWRTQGDKRIRMQ